MSAKYTSNSHGNGNGGFAQNKKRPASGSSNPGAFKSNKPAWANKPNDKREFRSTKPQPSSFKGKQPQRKDTSDAPVRRKRPVTQGGGEALEDEDEGSSDEMDVDEVDGEANGEGASGEPAEKRPKMSKAERAALHAAQPHRTSLLPSHPLLHGTLLPLWETARRADLGKEERKVAVKELWEAVKGRVGEVSRGHKGGRVLQTVSSQ
jgi:pumilio family protein 6